MSRKLSPLQSPCKLQFYDILALISFVLQHLKNLEQSHCWWLTSLFVQIRFCQKNFHWTSWSSLQIDQLSITGPVVQSRKCYSRNSTEKQKQYSTTDFTMMLTSWTFLPWCSNLLPVIKLKMDQAQPVSLFRYLFLGVWSFAQFLSSLDLWGSRVCTDFGSYYSCAFLGFISYVGWVVVWFTTHITLHLINAWLVHNSAFHQCSTCRALRCLWV